MDDQPRAPQTSRGRPTHFTYATPDGDSLCQGDVLTKSGALAQIIEAVHPHYLGDTYTHFMVLTQSCDLVRRGAGVAPRARYITLAAIRPLSLVIERRIEGEQDSLARAAGVCADNKRERIRQFLERLLNNNEPDFFYLHEDHSVGFGDSSCAFLRLSIAIRAQEHYDVCLGARCLSLSEGFRAKLGWLVGNIYSRVGTEDWVPTLENSRAFHDRLNDLLDHHCRWVPAEALVAARHRVSDAGLHSQDELRKLIDEVPYETGPFTAVRAVLQSLQQMGILDRSADLNALARTLADDGQVAQRLTKPT